MFGKKEITPEEVATGLLYFMKIEDKINKMIDDISSNSEVKENIYFQIFLLKVFCIDFSLHTIIGDTKEKAAIMDHIMINLIKDVPDGDPNAFIDYANKKQAAYAKALKTPHDLGPPFMIGKTFCEFICKEPDLKISFLGSAIFTSMMEATRQVMEKILKKYKISL
jgi:hypothetical protein